MVGARKPLDKYRRIVIKIGSALLVERKTGLKKAWLDAMCADIAALKAKGVEVLVVSSGAIALGRTVLNLPAGALKLEESQAAAAVGQIALARAWSESLSTDQIIAGQILLTLGDTEERRRYLNARATINQLLKFGSVPIINENDTVATTEIRYGDNDRLAARVATMVGADLLVLLSDIDGLYTAPPHLDPEARFLDTIAEISPEIEAMAGGNPSWNHDVDYRRLLDQSGLAELVRAQYRKAELSLDADLDALAKAPRIAADPGAVALSSSGCLRPTCSITSTTWCRRPWRRYAQSP